MNPKDDFLEDLHKKQNGKIRFALSDTGAVTHIIKRVDVRLFEVYTRLKGIRSAYMPTILALVKREDHLEVHEEYIQGRALDVLLQEEGAFSEADALCVAMDVSTALFALHQAQPPIVHRDVKPANILRSEDGRYILIDFDAARSYIQGAEADTTLIATVGYAAPEQYGLSQTDPRSDIFSLGATLYELRTGEAFRVGAACGGKLGRVIARCTAFDPNKRYKGIAQLQKDLRAMQPAAQKRQRDILWGAIGGTAILAAAVLLAVLLPKGQMPASTPAPQTIPASANYNKAVECTCDYRFAEVTSEQGKAIAFTNGDDPVSVQLMPTGKLDSTGCKATVHIVPSLKDFHITKTSVGAQGEITPDGMLTIRSEGVFAIKGTVIISDTSVFEDYECVIVATPTPEKTLACKCVFSGQESRPVFEGDLNIPTNGDPLVLDIQLIAVYDRSHCTAKEHVTTTTLAGVNIEQAPLDANCGVTEDNRFYTYTPGFYTISFDVYDGNNRVNHCRNGMRIN